MLPTLEDFGICCPVYLRKINSLAHWNPEGVNDNYDRAFRAAERLFQSPQGIYSFWKVATNEEFYSVIGALSALRSPQNQDINFIWLKESEILNIAIEPVPEGSCLRAESLHFNAQIEEQSAIDLCYRLLEVGREAYRCKKRMTTSILELQRSLRCKALGEQTDSCECELSAEY